MSLSIGIVGLPNVGKSTLFKVLTKKQVDIENYPFCTIDPNVGIVQVPDTRLQKLADFSSSAKVVPAVVEFVDIAGLVKGASEGEGLGNKFLANIREVDAIAEVVRVFKNDKIIHVHETIDPQNDIGVIETELILADLETVSNGAEKLEKQSKSGDKEIIKRLEVARKIKKCLEEGKPARKCELEEEDKFLIRDFHLITFKPILYIYNISGDDNEISDEMKSKNNIALDIKLEEEMTEMSDEDKKELGISSNINELVAGAYKLLGLINFLTTGEDETRSWTIKSGSTAPEAGAAIHTDFRDGFIKADVINWQDLLDTGSYAAAREKGMVRTEGKNYIVKDGDVIEFKV